MQDQRNWDRNVSYRILLTLPIDLGRTSAVDICRERKSKTMQMQNKCARHDFTNVSSHVCD